MTPDEARNPLPSRPQLDHRPSDRDVVNHRLPRGVPPVEQLAWSDGRRALVGPEGPVPVDVPPAPAGEERDGGIVQEGHRARPQGAKAAGERVDGERRDSGLGELRRKLGREHFLVLGGPHLDPGHGPPVRRLRARGQLEVEVQVLRGDPRWEAGRGPDRAKRTVRPQEARGRHAPVGEGAHGPGDELQRVEVDVDVRELIRRHAGVLAVEDRLDLGEGEHGSLAPRAKRKSASRSSGAPNPASAPTPP